MHGKCFYDSFGYFYSNKTLPFQTCVCDDGWTNFSNNDAVSCCYQRKSQFIAFLLEFLVGFGLGHFYIGNQSIAIVKLVSSIFLFCSCCSISFCFCNQEEGNYGNYSINDDRVQTSEQIIGYPLKYQIFNFILIFSFLAYVIWQCIDALLFGFNMFKDSNGIELNPW